MTDAIVQAIIAGGAGLLGTSVLIIKFCVFDVLQNQINQLREDKERQDKEIITLRNMVDDWQGKYHGLFAEHSVLQMKYVHLQSEFDGFRKKIKND